MGYDRDKTDNNQLKEMILRIIKTSYSSSSAFYLARRHNGYCPSGRVYARTCPEFDMFLREK
jgi:hypothetical protein